MATIFDVARHAAVSTSTVSHVVNGTRKVSAETARRVQEAIAAVGRCLAAHRRGVHVVAARAARVARHGERLVQAGPDLLAGHLHESQRGDLGHLMPRAVAPEALGFGTRVKLALARSIYGDQVPDAALNYVWDNRHAIGTLRDNAYTDRTRMLVLRSGAQDAGRWVLERRNVAEDFKLAFGNLPATLNGLALASDTDNTGGVAHAGFAQFRFVADADECGVPDGLAVHKD